MALFYVTQDPERATGIEHMLENYHVICPHASPTTDMLELRGARVFITGGEVIEKRGTYGMLSSSAVQTYINENTEGTRAHIMVLKTSSLIAAVCEEQGWDLWAPRAEIAKKYEDKISQYKALRDVAPFPQTQVSTLNNIRDIAYPAVMQFNAGHSGGGTILVENADDIAPYQKKFGERPVRIAPFMRGDTYTLNCVATKAGAIYTGSISLQLTGIPEATNNPLATVGNDFGIVGERLSHEEVEKIGRIAADVGTHIVRDGYRGLFGIDVLIEGHTRTPYFIEINTHQPASISFEAVLHEHIGALPLMLIFTRDMIEKDGFVPEHAQTPPLIFPQLASQIIYRNKEARPLPRDAVLLPEAEGVLPSRMELIQPGEELFRIQFYGTNA